jgi:hypothetical protein
MPMEKLLLVWDDLDDWMGMAWHGLLHVAHSVADAFEDVTRVTGDWLGALEVRSAVAATEAHPKA